ncbi:hypothetical protein ACFVIY_03320 [Streptomyces sp. NPDC127166]|uniref:hypothetical protein n=1 Tax=Streptomyces sp. NPDC127166 TaxID=3345380 RepID=UPI0036347EC1
MESTHRDKPGADRSDRPVTRPARESLPADLPRLATTCGTAHLAVNQSQNVQDGKTGPLTATDIETRVQWGLGITLRKSGDAVHPLRNP